MSVKPNTILVITGGFNPSVNAANTTTGFYNSDGNVNVKGTVIGVSQTAHSTAELMMLGKEVGMVLPLVGGGIGIANLLQSRNDIDDALKKGLPIKQADIASVIGGVASIAASGITIILGTGVIVTIFAVVGLGAGVYQYVASNNGWTADIDGKLVARFLSLDEANEVKTILSQAQKSGVIPAPDLSFDFSNDEAQAPRTSSNYFTANNAHSVTMMTGAVLSDLWVTQKNAAQGFTNKTEFYAALMACNPVIFDINNIQAGQTIYLPQKFADGSITYHYANGSSLNNNAATGEYYMVLQNQDGGQTIYQRTGNEATGYTIHQTVNNQDGLTTYDFIGTQASQDSDIIETSLTTVEKTGHLTITKNDTNGDGDWDDITTNQSLSEWAKLVTEDTNGDGNNDKEFFYNNGKAYDLSDTSDAIFVDTLLSKYSSKNTKYATALLAAPIRSTVGSNAATAL